MVTTVSQGNEHKGKLFALLGVGLAFHLVYMLSIFDIYFRSPLVHGMDPVNPSIDAPAKRLVLFVGDGCRADKAFELLPDGTPRMPYLHSKARHEGAFGVSHTRVPTESRPGHIAMIAGFYEDVSAVTKGWKANPVDYDHLLARAKYAWSFGAPEIVDLFSGPNVHGQHYAPEMIDFAANDAKSLDQWSFDRLHELIEAASVDEALKSKLSSDQVVIFVHLLGLDTNGHAFKPHSKEYLENVQFVDKGIEKAVKSLEDFYQDGRTAYIYTADHGMSDAGTHGDGDPDNTRTPLIAWGAGISKPLQDDGTHDEYSAGWRLSDLKRRDINQADMTPLMASLVGIPIPVNSEGLLPITYLEGDEKHKSMALLDNCRQIAASYRKKEEMKRRSEPFFQPFTVPASQISDEIHMVQQFINKEMFSEAQDLAHTAINQALEGLKYLHKYDSFLLKAICTAGYIGWIIHALIFVLRSYGQVKATDKKSTVITILFAAFTIGLFGFLAAKGSSVQYYAYSAFTLGFWHSIFQSRSTVKKLISGLISRLGSAPYILGYVLGLEALVLTFYKREILAVINMGLALALLFRFRNLHPALTTIWFMACTAMSAFPFMAPIKLANDTLYLTGVGAIILSAIVARHQLPLKSDGFMFWAKTSTIIMAAFVSKSSDSSLKLKQGLPLWNQNGAWALLAYGVLAPFLLPGKNNAMERFLDLFMTFAPAYILLSISYEPLFYACFGVQLAMWILLESSPSKKASRGLNFDSLWVCFGFLFFVNLAFFGTGNMASISSFTLESVYRFITVFSPFSMAALLILKLLLPFGLLSAAFGILTRRLGIKTVSLVLLVLATTDIMTLNFFHLVRDHGSWLEIGTSISHFVIASSLIIFTLVLAGLANILLSGVEVDEITRPSPKKVNFKTE